MKTFFRHYTQVFLLVSILIYLLGVLAQLGQSPLGCPDWPGCFGEVLMVPKLFSAGWFAPLMTLWSQNQLMIPWLMVGLSGFLLLLNIGERRQGLRGIVLASLVLVLTSFVAMRAIPIDHPTPLSLFLGLVMVFLIHRLFVAGSAMEPPKEALPFLTWLSRFGLLLLLIDAYLGGWLSLAGGGLSCPEVPTCLGHWLPTADYLGLMKAFFGSQGGDWALRSPGALIALNVLHRILAVLVFLMLTLLAQGLTSNPKAPALSKEGLWLSALLLIVVALGLGLVLLRLPVVLGVTHAFVALLLILRVSRIEQRLGRAPRGSLELQPTEWSSPSEAPPMAPVSPLPSHELPRPSSASLYQRLKGQLSKTRSGLNGFLGQLPGGRKEIDQAFLEELEGQLLMADMGVTVTRDIIRHLTDSLDRQELRDISVVKEHLKRYLHQLIEPVSKPLEMADTQRPFVILVVGVNGVGKTTTIGKLAKRLQLQGLSVMLAAGDTFRAAAVEQLQTWGERNQVPVIAQHTGADSASVIYDALEAAKARSVDVLIADTAGRLHNKSNLMDELSKIKRIMARLDPTAPQEVLLVLDGGTGQNALNQAREFHEAVGLTGIALTKLDGTAKGGVLFALAQQFGIPIRFIGVGEGIDDLQDFNADQFIGALFDENDLS